MHLNPWTLRLRPSRSSGADHKHPPRQAGPRPGGRRALLLGGAALALLLAAACTNDIQPKGGWSGPAASGDYLYLGSVNGRVLRADSSTGELDQAYQYPSKSVKAGLDAIYGSPLIRDGVVYGAGYTCRGNICSAQVFALDAVTGAPAWAEDRYDVPTKVAGLVAMGTDTLVFGTGQIAKEKEPAGYLYAVDPANDSGLPLPQQVTSRLKWRIAVDGAVIGGPAVEDDIAVFGTMGGTLYAVDLRDEARYQEEPADRILWSFKAKGAIVTVPLVTAEGRVYFGDIRGQFYSLNGAARRGGSSGGVAASAGEWSFEGGAWFWARPVAEDGVVYAATLSGKVYALDQEGGRPVWAAPADVEGPVIGAPQLVDTQRGRALAVPSHEKDVLIVRLSDGSNLGALFTKGGVNSAPAVVGDFIFVHAQNGELYTFSAKSLDRRACIVTTAEGERCPS